VLTSVYSSSFADYPQAVLLPMRHILPLATS
jgi:hypothetical protein